MPQLIDDDDFGDEEEGSPKGLRAQLGKVNAALARATERLESYEVRDLLTEKGFDLVEASDLKGVPADEREKKASELQGQRAKQQEALVRKMAEKLGVEDEDALEELVADLVGRRSTESDEAEQVGRARELNRLESDPVPAVDPRKLHGDAAIEYAIEQNQRKSRKR